MLYYILSAIAAALIAIMIAINGQLTLAFSILMATVIIHVIGLVLISAVLAGKRENPFRLKGVHPLLLSGGAIGVITTLCNSASYGHISVSAMVALSLFGQAITAIVVDQFGLIGMPVKPFNKAKLAGFLVTGIGLVFLLVGAEIQWMAVFYSLLTGITVVTSRCVNARLAEKTSGLTSTWYNYVVGLAVAFLVLILADSSSLSMVSQIPSTPAWIYLGGAIGVATVFLFNIITPKLSAYKMTMILFAGQLLTGVIIDLIITGSFMVQNLIGAIFTVLGLVINVQMDMKAARKKVVPIMD